MNATDVTLLQDHLPAGDLEPFTDFVWQPLSSVAWDTVGFASASPAKRAEIVAQLRILFASREELARRTARAHATWEKAWDQDGLDGLLEAMTYQGSLPVILDQLQLIYQRFATRDPQRATACREASALLASLLSGRAMSCRVEAGRLALDVASPNLAELGVALLDGQPVDFIEVPGDYPRARNRAPLTTTLDGGITIEQKARDHRKLLEHYLFNVLNQRPWIYPESVKSLESHPDGKKLDLWIETVQRRLRRLTRNRQRAPYVVVDQRFRKVFGLQAEPFLEVLKESFPELRQVQLTGNPDNRPKEDDQLEPLWNILDLLPEEDLR